MARFEGRQRDDRDLEIIRLRQEVERLKAHIDQLIAGEAMLTIPEVMAILRLGESTLENLHKDWTLRKRHFGKAVRYPQKRVFDYRDATE